MVVLTEARRRWPVWGAAALISASLVGFTAIGLADAPVLGLPDEFIFPGNDLVILLQAGALVAVGQSPYQTEAWAGVEVYQYSPLIAVLLAGVFRAAPEQFPFFNVAYLYLLTVVVALPLAWWIWRAVFRAANLSQAEKAMVTWAPLWLVYSQWFFDLTYLNVSTFWLCLTGALTWAVLRQRTWWAVLLVVVIALAKPHHLYPLLIPLLLGRWRWWLRVMVASSVGYGLTVLLTVFAVGLDFGLVLYQDYLGHLLNIAERYPWTTRIFYNHSWQSILYWLFGFQTWVAPVVTGIRLLFVLPLLWLLWQWRQPPLDAERRSQLALGLCFAAHLWALMLVSDLWEAQLLIVVGAYLLAMGGPRVRRWARVIAVPFGLLGVAQLAGWGVARLVGRSFIDFDLVAHLPVLMPAVVGIYLLTFLALRSHLKFHRTDTPLRERLA